MAPNRLVTACVRLIRSRRIGVASAYPPYKADDHFTSSAPGEREGDSPTNRDRRIEPDRLLDVLVGEERLTRRVESDAMRVR